MLARNLIITIVTAGIVAGSLGLSASAASAAQPGPAPMFGQHYPFEKDFDRKGPKPGVKPGKAFDKNWNRPGIQPHKGGFVFNTGKPVCSPVYAQKWRWSPWGGWQMTKVKVDEKCSPQNFRVAPPRW